MVVTALAEESPQETPENMKHPEKQSAFWITFLLLAALLVVALMSQGCFAVRQHHNVVGVTESVVGIDISQNQGQTTPHFRLGYVRSQFHVVPVATNEMYAPPVISSMEVNAGAKREINESFATGDAVEWMPEQTTAQIKAHFPTNAPPK